MRNRLFINSACGDSYEGMKLLLCTAIFFKGVTTHLVGSYAPVVAYRFPRNYVRYLKKQCKT